MDTRTVTANWVNPDGTPAGGAITTFELDPSTYDTDAMILGTVTISATADPFGKMAVDLVVNAAGLQPSAWTVTWPSGRQDPFVLEAGDTPISLRELLGMTLAGWHPVDDQVIVDIAIQGIYDALANTTDPLLGAALVGSKYDRTLRDRVGDRRSILDLIPTAAERDAIRAGTSTTDTSAYWNIMLNSGQPYEVPAGDYILNKIYDTGVNAYSLLCSTNNANIRLDPNARLLVRAGAASRPVVFRGVEGVSWTGGQIIDERPWLNAQGKLKGGVGICLENTSKAIVSSVHIKNFGAYAVAVTENTATFRVAAPTISYVAATHRIQDSNRGLTEIYPGNTIYVSGSVSNNGLRHVVATSGDGAWVEVAETVVDEAAGASSVGFVSSTVSVTAETKTFSAESGGFNIFAEDDRIRTSGFAKAGNNGDFTVTGVDGDGLTLSVAETTLVDEAAGRTVTITQLGVSAVKVMDFTPCNEITIDHVWASGCGKIGFEIFPKELSYGLIVTNNYAYNCGFAVTGGTGYKVAQMYVDAQITGNTAAHCQNGISMTNWGIAHYSNNIVLNCEKYAYPITSSTQPLAGTAPFELLTMHDNIAAITMSFAPDPSIPFDAPGWGEPVITDVPFVQKLSYYACNLNGLYPTPGRIEITDNAFRGWAYGLGVNVSHVRFPNVVISGNTFDNCGSSVTETLIFTGTLDGTATISNPVNIVPNPPVSGTAGWYAGSEIVGPGIPFGAKLLSVDPVAKTLTMNTNATASGPVTFYSGAPVDLLVENNHFLNTDLTRAVAVRLLGRQMRAIRNVFQGYDGNCLRLGGDGSRALGNVFIEPNPLAATLRGVIQCSPDFAGDNTGTYEVRDTVVDLGRYQAEGSARILFLINYNNTAGLRAANNVCTNGSVRPLYQTSAPVLPTLLGQVGANRFWSATIPPASGNITGDICYNPAPTTARNIALWTALSATVWRAHGNGTGTTANRPTLGTNDAGYLYRDTSILRDLRWNGTTWDTAFEAKTVSRIIATRTIANTLTETSMFTTAVGSLTLLANLLVAGTTIRAELSGTIGTTGTPTLQLRSKLGTTTIVDSTALPLPTLPAGSQWHLIALYTCRVAGAAGTVEGSIWFAYNVNGALNVLNIPPTLTPYDTTASGAVGLTAQWGTAAAANSLAVALAAVQDYG